MHFLGLLFFSVGIVFGIALSGLAVWGDLEASLFAPSTDGEKPLSTLRCPVVISPKETGRVTASFSNPLEKLIERNVRAYISEGHISQIRIINTKLRLSPGEKKSLDWAVNLEDAAFGRLIFVRVNMLPRDPLPSRDATCGIVVLNLGLIRGSLLVTAIIIATVLFVGVGLGLWIVGNKHKIGRIHWDVRTIGGLAGVILASMFVALLGWWILGALFLVITFLMILEIFRHYATKPRYPSIRE